MNEDRILAKAEKLGYTNLGKDNKEKIANLKEQLGIEDLDELESSLDGMLSEQPGEGEGLEDIEYLDDEIYEEGNNTSNSIQREQSELEEEIDDTENNDLENKENKNENNETNDLKSEDNKQKENNSDNSKNKDNTNKPNEKEKELDKESEKKSSNEKNPQSTKQKNSEKKLNEPNSKNNNSHNKFKGAKKTTEQKKAAPKLGKNKAVSKNVGKTPNASKAVSNIGKSVGKAGKALGNAIKKMAVQAGKAIAKAIGAAIKALLSNPYVLLALAIILVIVLLIMIIASFFDDFETNAQAYGYYDSTCDFNKVKINYTIDVVSSVYAEILDIGVYTLEIDEFIKGAALYYELISNYTDEEIKAMMIVLKTNALSKGEYKSDSETLYLNVLDMGYLPLSTANKKTKEKYDKLYDEVNEMLYLPNTVNRTIN